MVEEVVGLMVDGVVMVDVALRLIVLDVGMILMAILLYLMQIGAKVVLYV